MELSVSQTNPPLPAAKGSIGQGIAYSLVVLMAAVYGFFQIIFLVEDLTVPTVIGALVYPAVVMIVTEKLISMGRTQTAKAFVACSIAGGLLVVGLLIFIIQGISAAIGFC